MFFAFNHVAHNIILNTLNNQDTSFTDTHNTEVNTLQKFNNTVTVSFAVFVKFFKKSHSFNSSISYKKYSTKSNISSFKKDITIATFSQKSLIHFIVSSLENIDLSSIAIHLNAGTNQLIKV